MGVSRICISVTFPGGVHVDSVTTLWEPLILPTCFLLSGTGNPRILQDALGDFLGSEGCRGGGGVGWGRGGVGGDEVGEKHISTPISTTAATLFSISGVPRNIYLFLF